MCALSNKWTGVVAYLAFVAGVFVLCAHLSSHVARQAIAVAVTYLPEQGPRSLSLVERRQIDAAQGVQPRSQTAETKEVVLTMPAIPPQVMAAQLDRSERADLIVAQPSTRPARYRSRRVASRASLTAAEEFGRRFGVLTLAAR